MNELTCKTVIAGLVHLPGKQLQPDDGVDYDDKYHQKSDVEQRDHSLED